MTQLWKYCHNILFVSKKYLWNSYTSMQCGLLLSMYMDSTCYTLVYNDNSGMNHEPMHKLYYTGNTVILELNST